MQRKVAAIDSRGQGVCLEETMPALGPGEVKVRVEASLISPGSELGRVGAMRANPRTRQATSSFWLQQRRRCRRGRGQWSRRNSRWGRVWPAWENGYALHADWACVPQNLCAAIPEGVSFAEAASVHLAATGLHTVRRTAPLYGGKMGSSSGWAWLASSRLNSPS